MTWNGPAGTAGNVSAKSLIDTIAGTSSVWDKVQFKKFYVYGVATSAGSSTTAALGEWPSLTVTLNSSGVSGFAASDKPSFYCDAVPGQRRAHLNITPNRLFRESWLDATNTEPLLTILTEPYQSSQVPNLYACYVQFTCVLRSTVGTFSQYQTAVDALPATVYNRVYDRYGEFIVTVGNTSEQPVPVISDPALQVTVNNPESDPVWTRAVSATTDPSL